MLKTSLRKIKPTDRIYFATWWRDQELRKLTSGRPGRPSDQKVDKYFRAILGNEKDHHFMIAVDKKTIGHLTLGKRRSGWYETQIVIGEHEYWGRGVAKEATTLVLNFAREYLKLRRISAEYEEGNAAIGKALERAGFEQESISNASRIKDGMPINTIRNYILLR